ncbi:hypothetical protein SKAU_G00192890 [Synaphobranchus kaupii]|uniref:Uncharacterized protein n=1 Tax=Synaphobranchus kaupii TaxID=118154 RepID=A0A9Q1FEA9_SYNKA|nr:hypothetical protein SKAU_G00192890 [Synaphobranchus kaupii]
MQSNEVGNSQCMEKEGFERSIEVLEKRGLKIKAVVTDRHTGVQKFMRKKRKDIVHYFDPWHMGKGVGKNIDALAKLKNCQEVGPWRKSVVNHLYWSGSTSTSGKEVVAKWTSVANHIQDIHIHDCELFPKCLHQPLIGEQARQWLKPSTAACEKLTEILLAPRLMKDMEKISPGHRTSAIESFHSLVLKFAPKNVVFSFLGILCRLQLAVMHYNENSKRLQATTKEGQLRYSVVFPKYKRGDFTVRPLKSDPTFGYVDNLMDLLCDDVVGGPHPYQELLKKTEVPEKLCAQFTRPDKEEAVARHQSRFFTK